MEINAEAVIVNLLIFNRKWNFHGRKLER